MAFCKKCGTQLQGDERFCVGCGTEISATPAAAVPPTAIPPGPQATIPIAQPVPGAPGTYLPPGAIPIAVLPPPPPKRGGRIKTLLIIAVIVGIGYYYVKHQPLGPADATALIKQQAFDASWQNVYGFVQVSSGKWTNNATVAIDSATLECDQFDSIGTALAQMRTTLNGPVQPGASASFNPFQMGAVATNVYKVTCKIVHVKTGN